MIRSLRARLFLIIVPPLLAIALATAVARYVAADRMSQRLYDNTLLAVALAISRDVVLSEGDILDDALRDRLSATLGDALFYRVTGPDGGFVTGYSELPPPPEAFDIAAESPKFYDSESRGAPVRVVALHEFIDEPQFGGWVDVHVWQTVRARDALSLRLAVQAGGMMALVILGAGSAVIFGIAYGLKPLLDLREAVERRSPTDLGPIRRPVPREVKGLVEAMNQLFGRLAEAFAARDEFIANAAHQLRNPIAAIQAQAEAAVTAPTDREMRARARGVAEAARRTGRLTQQLLSMEKVRGRPDVATAEVDIEDVAAGVMRIHAPDAMRHGAENLARGRGSAVAGARRSRAARRGARQSRGQRAALWLPGRRRCAGFHPLRTRPGAGRGRGRRPRRAARTARAHLRAIPPRGGRRLRRLRARARDRAGNGDAAWWQHPPDRRGEGHTV